jgi:peptidoglycan-associated lipoprotein
MNKEECMFNRLGNRTAALSLVVFVVAAGAGCAHVNREELGTELDSLSTQLRAEQEASAEELSQRIDSVEARVDELDARQARSEERLEGRIDELEASLRELETEMGVTIERLENAIAFSVPLFFEFDSYTLEDDQTGVLDRFAGIYSEYYGGNLLTVEGFTDEAGSEEYNMRLGQRRAEQVKSYLTEIGGLSAERVRTVSYGESPERLVAPGEYGHSSGQENRRVVLVIDTAAPTGEIAGTGR